MKYCKFPHGAYDRAPMKDLLAKFRVHQVTLSQGVIVSEDMPLEDAVRMMRERKTGCLITKKGNSVTGIFTERDLMMRVMDESIEWTTPLKHYTTKNPVTMGADEDLNQAIDLMRRKNVRHIPVFTSDEKLLGVLSVRNVINILAEHFPYRVMNLPPRVHTHPDSPEGG